MLHRIGLTLHRTVTRLLNLLAPAKGRRRRRTATPRARTATGLPLRIRRIIPPRLPRRDSNPTTPDTTTPHADAPILDSPSPLVRPYLLAHEQHERRTALALALDGVDIGPWVIHGHPIGAPGMLGVAA
ncbi:hypothetical protein [Streptomyces apocyni]|uniref:hypothetical protein n=1 Tax=Streptomyces apocyni TaxID=2654677 RepID=UPI0012EA55DD|nr:hypothetical protein [Streptomyces apocyni]